MVSFLDYLDASAICTGSKALNASALAVLLCTKILEEKTNASSLFFALLMYGFASTHPMSLLPIV